MNVSIKGYFILLVSITFSLTWQDLGYSKQPSGPSDVDVKKLIEDQINSDTVALHQTLSSPVEILTKGRYEVGSGWPFQVRYSFNEVKKISFPRGYPKYYKYQHVCTHTVYVNEVLDAMGKPMWKITIPYPTGCTNRDNLQYEEAPNLK